jgi:secretion/DNA translocation related TadE-like protein
MHGDTGSGSVLGLALAGGTLAALATVVPLYSALVTHESVAEAADASALAAADVAAGISPGVPCAVAVRLAAANHAVLDACAVDGLVATVRARAVFLGFTVEVTATAGPPVVVTN